MKKKILEVKDLTFSYDDKENALENITVDIFEQDKIAVLGANGSGKSTFFLNLNGVRQPTKGEIYLDKKLIHKKTRNELRKAVGIVFQDADSQIIGSTVMADVAFGPLNRKLSQEEVVERSTKAIHKLNLNSLQERPPHCLSGGEKKRVSIAGVLAMDQKVIIFDEPTASLDSVHVKLVEDILEELGKEEKTILLSTHDVDLAYRFANRIIVFHEGNIIADGLPADVFSKTDILKQAHLKKPTIMQMYEMLLHKKMINKVIKQPKTIEDMEELLK